MPVPGPGGQPESPRGGRLPDPLPAGFLHPQARVRLTPFPVRRAVAVRRLRSPRLESAPEGRPDSRPRLKAAARALDFKDTLASEYRFLAQARDYLRGMDLLLVTGSNQFLDNFGGPWGFPYTLLKWTLLAKKNGTRVAFISVGAGPLSHPLSFFMLKHTLRRADFVSFRDQGSWTWCAAAPTRLAGSTRTSPTASVTTVPVPASPSQTGP